MTNREWLESRTNEEFAKILNENGVCDFCIEPSFQCSMECQEKIKIWLESEVEEK